MDASTMNAPGVYTFELPSAPTTLSSVSSSTYASVGLTERGPVNDPQYRASWPRWVEMYAPKSGGFIRGSWASYCVYAAFANDLGVALFNRVVLANAAKAAANVTGTGVAASYIGRPQLATDVVGVTTVYYNLKFDVDDIGALTVDVTGDMGVGGTYPIATIAANINAAVKASVAPDYGAMGYGLAADGKFEIASLVSDVTGYKRLKLASKTVPIWGGAVDDSQVELQAAAANDCALQLLGLIVSAGPPAVNKTFNGVVPVKAWVATAYSEGIWAGVTGTADGLKITFAGNDDYGDEKTGWTRFDAQISEYNVDTAQYDVVDSYEAVDLTDPTAADYFPDVFNARSMWAVISEGVDKITDNVAAPYTVGIPRELVPAVVYYGISPNMIQAVGTGAQTAFSFVIPHVPIAREGLTVNWTKTSPLTMTDDGYGNLLSTGGSTGTIDYTTGAVSLTFVTAEIPDNLTLITTQVTTTGYISNDYTFSGGSDGTGSIDQTITTSAALEADGKGIYAFDTVIEPLNVAIPDLAGVSSVHNDLISWARRWENRFIILGFELGTTLQEALDFVRTEAYDTKYAAIYYPWIKISDPNLAGRNNYMPPHGHIAGVYARCDMRRNVGSFPAGMEVGYLNFCQGFEMDLTYTPKTGGGEVGILNKKRINCLMQKDFTGKVVWGCRTLSLDPTWRYVNGPRLFMMVEVSVFLATHWICFQNNTTDLRSRIKFQIDSYLLGLQRNKYFAGDKPSESYQVICDSTNNDAQTFNDGLVVCDVGLAVHKPAEFAAFRFSQKTAA